MKTTNIRKVLLITLISSLSISALIAIVMFLVGNITDQWQLLFTTLVLAGFSLTGFCSSVLIDKRRYMPFAYIGIAIAIIGFVVNTYTIWTPGPNSPWNYSLTLAIISFSLAHISLLASAKSSRVVNTSAIITSVFIIIVAGMLIHLIWPFYINSSGPATYFYRLLGVFAVLDVLGTIVTPLLGKFSSKI